MNSNPEQEGIIKFALAFRPSPPPVSSDIAELNAWRQILHGLGLTGREPDRYQGLAYGNVSRRTGPRQFIVSGSQTGAKPALSASDYCTVQNFDLDANWLEATGAVKPSSEALTHAAVYESNPAIACVLHAHSPLLWQFSGGLGLVQTPPAIAYGTPAMARAVSQFARHHTSGILSMGGHEDGLIAFADDIPAAAWLMLDALAQALRLQPMPDEPGQG